MGNDRSLLLQLGRELRDSIHAGAALAALTLAAGCAGRDVTTTGVNPGDHSSTTPDITTTPDARTPDATVTTPEPHDAAPITPEPSDATPPAEFPHEPYSLAQLGCFGPGYDGGYYGQCCFEAQCYTPDTGEGCLPAESLALRSKIRLPVGSGDCGCSVADQGHPDAIAGPFAANPADMADTADAGGSIRSGSCCYVVGSISCTGRPFCVDGTQLVADAVARADWLLG